MRRLRPEAFLLLPVVCLAVALSAWAGDTVEEDPDARKVSGKVPKKKFDLSGVNTTKRVEDPKAVRKRKEEEKQKKEEEIVRYKAAEIAPEGPQVVLHFPDVSRMYRSAEKSPVGRLMAEEMLGRVWRTKVLASVREIPAARKGTPTGSGMLAMISRLKEVCQGEVLVAFYGAGSSKNFPAVLMIAEMEGEARTSFRDSVGDIRKWAGFGDDSSTKVASSGKFEFDKVIHDKKVVACYGFVGNHLVVSVGESLYQKVLAAATSKGDHSLSRDVEWNAAVRKLGKNADMYLKADYEKAMLSVLGPDAKKEQVKAVKAAAKGIRYFGAALNFSAGAVRERFIMELEKDSDIFKMLPGSGPNTALAKLIPLDAAYYDIQMVKPGAAAISYRRSLKGLPEEQRKHFNNAIDKMFAKSKLSLEKDILPAFGGHFASAVVLTGMGATMDFDILIVVQPANREKVKNVLMGLDRAGGKEFRSDTYMGAQLKYWVRPESEGGKPKVAISGPRMPWMKKAAAMAEGPLGPIKAYAIANQYVILGTSARVVKLAVRQTDPAVQSSCIEDKPDFRAVRSSVGAAPNEIQSGYLDLRRLAELCYSLAGAAGVGAELPPADKVLGELTGMFWSVRREASGISMEVSSPTGMLPLAGAGFMGAWVGAMNAAAQAERVAHTRKLKACWRGLETFATDFGRYPLKPSELFKVYVEDSRNFVTPDQEQAEMPVRIKEAADLNTKSGYSYVSGLSPNSTATTVIMYSARTDSRGRHWCLFTSGKVRAVAPDELKGMLKGF